MPILTLTIRLNAIKFKSEARSHLNVGQYCSTEI